MANNTRNVQEYLKLEATIQELTEQVRQMMASNAASTRQRRMDFPRFVGEDLRGWLYRCDNFFELAATPWDMKVRIASAHLEGKALQWHQVYMLKRMTRDAPRWEEYVQALHIRFGATVFEDSRKVVQPFWHTHQLPTSFIKAEVRGLSGSIFCDFGSEFTVIDVNGEDLHTGIVASISNDNPARISCTDDERLEVLDGDLVVFSEVQGMTELNDGKPRRTRNARSYSFILEEDTSGYNTYERGGIITQLKLSKSLRFKPLKEALKDPGDFLLSDFLKFDRPPLLHMAFPTIDKFLCDFGRYPVVGSENDAQSLISIATIVNDSADDAKLENINPKLLRHFAFGSIVVLDPMATMFESYYDTTTPNFLEKVMDSIEIEKLQTEDTMFVELNMDLFKKCREPMEKCLRDSKMDESIILVRGSKEFKREGIGVHTFEKLVQRMMRCMILVLKENLQQAQPRMKIQAAKHIYERQFAEGERVYVKLRLYLQRTLMNKNYSKLSSLYYGPFQIQQKIGQGSSTNQSATKLRCYNSYSNLCIGPAHDTTRKPCSDTSANRMEQCNDRRSYLGNLLQHTKEISRFTVGEVIQEPE